MPQSSALAFGARWVLIAVLQPPSARSSGVGTLPGRPKCRPMMPFTLCVYLLPVCPMSDG
jgi:hypothetical protein